MGSKLTRVQMARDFIDAFFAEYGLLIMGLAK